VARGGLTKEAPIAGRLWFLARLSLGQKMPSAVAGLKSLLRTLSRSLWQTPRTALGSNWPRSYQATFAGSPKKDLSSGSGLRIAFSSWLRIKAAPAVQSRAIGRQSMARTARSPCEGKRGKRNEARGVFPTKRSPSAGATGNGKTAWLSSRLGISANPAAASVYHGLLGSL
jgi:hypothetical protein